MHTKLNFLVKSIAKLYFRKIIIKSLILLISKIQLCIINNPKIQLCFINIPKIHLCISFYPKIQCWIIREKPSGASVFKLGMRRLKNLRAKRKFLSVAFLHNLYYALLSTCIINARIFIFFLLSCIFKHISSTGRISRVWNKKKKN